MKNPVKEFPLHTLLICPAVIFFLYVHNYPDVYLNSTYRSLLYSILSSAAILGSAWLVFRRNLHKAGFYSTVFIILMLSYGIVYDLLEELYYAGYFPFSHIHRHLIAAFLITLAAFYIITTKKRKTFRSVTFPMNFFVFMIFILNIVVLSSSATKEEDSKPAAEGEDTLAAAPALPDSFPDIYYIILDGYASDSTLKDAFGSPDNSFTALLKKNGFYLADSSRANYLVTIESLRSSLNMNYLDTLPKKQTIFKNLVSKYLKQKGYRVVHMNSGYSVTRENYYADERIILEGPNEFERSFLRYSIFRLDDLIGYSHYSFLKEQLKKIYNVIDIKGPKFAMLHIVSPHPPYVCDENGKFHKAKKVKSAWWEPREDYLQQLKYINREMENFIPRLIRSGKNKKIIIIQSDHGPWIRDNAIEKVYDARSRILNAYYIPYPFSAAFYSSITPVNSFRVIFNGLFRDSLPPLKDAPMTPRQMSKYPQTGEMLHD